jgi:predicted nucleic acid-binding protein
MILSYFDSSVLLAILLDEEKQEEAYGYWQNSMRVSSILLKIETTIGLRRIYETNKRKLEKNWLNKKKKILDEYLNEVNYKIIDNRIEREIYIRKDLSQCRSLDAIHIATALQFREINNNEETNLYTFDRAMHNLAKYYKFTTNRVS